MKDDPIWLSFVLGPLVWMALFAIFVDWNSLSSVCLWAGGSATLNVALVSIAQPWLERVYRRDK